MVEMTLKNIGKKYDNTEHFSVTDLNLSREGQHTKNAY